MPQYYIVFDTSYIRSLGVNEYLKGEIPPRLETQLEIAFERGDIVGIPKTVWLEISAWVEEKAQDGLDKLKSAADLLISNGYEIVPAIDDKPKPVRVLEILHKKFPNIYILEPTYKHYADAERRTSYRLPPLPKNPKGEEFRDRIIWCQLLSLSEETDLPILIVSGDTIFENGADSEEGQKANIQVVKTEDDLTQRLDRRPPIIQKIIDDIFLFEDQIREHLHIGIEAIKRIEDYRAQIDDHGIETKTFKIILDEKVSLPFIMQTRLTYRGGIPVFLNLRWGRKPRELEIIRDLSEEEMLESNRNQQIATLEREILEGEFKRLLRG